MAAFPPSNHFGEPFAGFFLANDFFIAACQSSFIFNRSGFRAGSGCLVISCKLIGKKLQSDIAALSEVFGLVDHTHTARARGQVNAEGGSV
jgi:hypothetical protein